MSYRDNQAQKKKSKTTSAYGAAVEIVCKDPSISREQLHKKMKSKKFDTEKSKTSINTAYQQVVKVYSLLKQHGHIHTEQEESEQDESEQPG